MTLLACPVVLVVKVFILGSLCGSLLMAIGLYLADRLR